MSLITQDISSVTKIIQGETRKIINGQSFMKSELIAKIERVDKEKSGDYLVPGS